MALERQLDIPGRRSDTGPWHRLRRNPWLLVLAVATVLALLSLLSNITTEAQLSGEDRALYLVRSYASRILNSGTAWAGLGVLAGWIVGRPVRGALAAVLASQWSLVAHYSLGILIGVMEWSIWAENVVWFLAAVVLSAPLGAIGAWTRRRAPWALAARLVVPAGAVLEPFVRGSFTAPPAGMVLPDRPASVAAGITILAGGLLGAILVLRSWRRTE